MKIARAVTRNGLSIWDDKVKNSEYLTTYGNPLAALPQGIYGFYPFQINDLPLSRLAPCVTAAEECKEKNGK